MGLVSYKALYDLLGLMCAIWFSNVLLTVVVVSAGRKIGEKHMC